MKLGIYEPGVPDKPTSFTATGNGTSVDLAWEIDSDGGSDVTKVEYQHREDGDAWPTDWEEIYNTEDGESVVNSKTVSGLDVGNKYNFKLRAINAVGTSSDSSTKSAYTKPAAPTGLTTTSVGGTSINLSWDDPQNDSITVYEYATSSGGDWNEIADSNDTTSTTSITNLATGTAYTIELRAVNDAGDSDAASIAVTTALSDLSLIHISEPTRPY